MTGDYSGVGYNPWEDERYFPWAKWRSQVKEENYIAIPVRAVTSVQRDWGYYQILYTGPRHQVKRLVLNPGKRISVQLHRHRDERWTVVEGVARIMNCGEWYNDLNYVGECCTIFAGEKHCVENIGKINLEIIEVQMGSYLGEDDIVRFDEEMPGLYLERTTP